MTEGQLSSLTVELCNNLKRAMLQRVKDMPPTWDGSELRQLMADLAKELFTSAMSPRDKRDYMNARLINPNL